MIEDNEAEPQRTLARGRATPHGVTTEQITWQPGEVIADLYEVKQRLGGGGMGEVWLVHHQKWNVDLAVKSPLPQLVDEPQARHMFIREAETWVDLDKHLNIATCYYVRELGGLPRIFIDYVDGGNLRDWMTGGKVKDWEATLRIAIEIASGMAHAHQNNLIHRDLKPENVLLTKEGEVKLTDFGLVRKLGEREILGKETEKAWEGGTLVKKAGAWASMSMEGGAMGTPAYMSPEQWREAHKAGKETDIYSFGVILFEMVCAKKPYEIPEEYKDAIDELKISLYRTMHCEDPIPDPKNYRNDCPDSLTHVITRCLQKEAESRYPDFDSLRKELLSIYQELVGSPYPHPKVDEVKLRADDLNNKGVSLLDLGKEAQAQKNFEQALETDPHHLFATYNLGLLQWGEGKITDETLLETMRSFTSEEGNYLTGLVHLERADLENAEKCFKQALKSSPDNPDYLNDLGLALFGMERYSEATDCFSAAKEHSSATFRCKLNLACSLLKQGRKTEAISHVSELISSKQTASSLFSVLNIPPTGDIKAIVPPLTQFSVPRARPLRTFEGHTGPIESACFSPDGRYALSGSWDKTVRLWDISTGKCLRTFEGQDYAVNPACFSPDGRYALCGGSDNTVKLWDISSGKCLRTFEGHKNWVYSVCFSPDGRYALSGGGDKTVKLWDISSGKCLRTFEGHGQEVYSVCFSPDGGYALSGSYDDTVKLWDISTGKCLRTFEGHGEHVWSVCFSPDGRYALSGSYDKTVKLWDISSGKCLRTFEGHTSWVDSVCFSPDGRYALSGSRDYTVRLWDISTWPASRLNLPLTYELCKVRKAREDIEISSQVDILKKEFDTLIQDKYYSQAYQVITNIRSFPGYERSPEILALINSLGNKYGNRISLLDGWHLRTFEGHTGLVNSVCFSPDGRYALSGSFDGTIKLWDISSGKCLRTFEGHRTLVNSVCFSPDGRYALSGSGDKTVKLWDISTGKCLRTFEGHTGNVDCVCFSPDGRYALSGSWDYTLKFWDISSGKCLRTFEGHRGAVNSVCFSPDGRYALSAAGSDITLMLWDISSGKCLRTFEEQAWALNPAYFSPDGRYALSGGGDNNVKLWDISSGKCLRIFEGHRHLVYSVCFSPDGRYALSGGGDKTVKLWDISSGKCLRTFEGHGQHVYSVCFSPDGGYALSGSDDETLTLWELDWEWEFPHKVKSSRRQS